MKFNEHLFLQEVQNIVLSFDINHYSDVDDAWLWIKRHFLTICNKYAPIHYVRSSSSNKPWVTKDVINLIHQRNKLHSLAIKLNRPILMEEYRRVRNMVTLTIRHAKHYYFHNSIRSCQGNHSKMWKVLNQALGKSSTSDSNDITSEQFNNDFASIGSKLADKFDTCLPNCPPADSIYTFRFNSITLSDVFKELSLLSSKPKLDILDFDSYLLHISAQSIAIPLTCIFNLSCKTGHVPDDFKKVRVTPIFKKSGSVNKYTNYRPISVVSYVAKVLMIFFSIDQSAFLTNHSLQRVNDDFLENIDDKNITLVSCFDLKKCFDSIIHSVLLNKL